MNVNKNKFDIAYRQQANYQSNLAILNREVAERFLYMRPIHKYYMNMAYIERHITNKINHLLEQFPCLVIIGPRQCGKTELSKMLRPDWQYYDLENPQTFDLIHDDLNFFFQQNPNQLIIDEAQISNDLFKTLRGVIDSDRKNNNRFILTGSSSPELLEQASESLAGRVAIINLAPFKISELQQQPLSPFYRIFESVIDKNKVDWLLNLNSQRNITDVLHSFLVGGYPDASLNKNTSSRVNWMEQYFQTYIYRDIKNLYGKLDTTKYRRLIAMLSSLSGTIINRSQLGRSLDINESSVKNYLDIAHGTMIWRNIPAFHHSRIKSIIKMPKGILRDSGLANFLQGLTTQKQLNTSPYVGQNFESFVIEEILRGIESSTVVNWSYSYFRTKSGAEIDLILQGSFGLLPIEIKYATSTRKRQLTSLQNFINEYQLPFGLVINNSQNISMLSDNIIQIPSRFI